MAGQSFWKRTALDAAMMALVAMIGIAIGIVAITRQSSLLALVSMLCLVMVVVAAFMRSRGGAQPI